MFTKKSIKKIVGMLATASLVVISNAQAQPLGSLIPGLLQSHDKIKAAQDELKSKVWFRIFRRCLVAYIRLKS